MPAMEKKRVEYFQLFPCQAPSELVDNHYNYREGPTKNLVQLFDLLFHIITDIYCRIMHPIDVSIPSFRSEGSNVEKGYTVS